MRRLKVYAGPNLNFAGSPDQASVKGRPVRNGIVKSTSESVESSLRLLKMRVPPRESLVKA